MTARTRYIVSLVVVLGLVACDQAAEVEPPRPAVVAVTPSTAELSALGATVRLSAEVRDQNGQPMPSAAVSWTSGALAVATVDGSGVVTAASNGAATITATAGAVSGAATVTVAQVVASVAVTPAADTVVEADTLRLAALAVDANGHEVTGTALAWTSADTLVAVVDNEGLVTGVAVGAVAVEASTTSGLAGQAAIEVVAPVPSAVSVAPDSVVLVALGASARLSAEVLDQVDRVMEGAAVAWTSGDTMVAVVDSAGVVTAVSEGTAAVTATAGAASGTAAVTVAQVAGSVVVTPVADTVELGDTLRLAAEAFDENGHRVGGAEFTWSSGDASVASVDGSGLVRGAAEGTATITAAAGEASGTSDVTVMNPDRAALVALYEATGGTKWSRSRNWLSDAPVGTWSGVTVNEEGRVAGLSLIYANLTGSIPPELGSLHAMRELGLGGNDLIGRIPPELGNLSKLEALSVGSNGLSGPIPPELGNLASLRVLYLAYNDLTGPIPADLGKLATLERLNLTDNDLTGIPPGLGGLTALVDLDLSRNELTGPIPPELGKLTALTSMNFSGNELTGPIPPELGTLTALTSINLSLNDLTGEIPGELGALSALRGLWLYGNGLTGLIPPELGKLSVLESLFLGHSTVGPSGNRLTGEIPGELGDLSALTRLDLSHNGLTGSIPPALGKLHALTTLTLAYNELSGPLPGELLNLTGLSAVILRGTEVCVPGTAAFWQSPMARGTARYFTPRGWCNANDQAVLKVLYEAAGGSGWERQNNWVSDDPVLSEWHGVTADSLGRVVALGLSANNLVGRITSVPWGGLAGLEVLDVADNPRLRGPLPLSLTRVALDTLRFSGTELCSLRESREWLNSILVAEGTGETCEPQSDRDILIALYEGAGGSYWNRNDNWLTDAPLGEWYGVRVDDDGRVTGLELRGRRNRTGPIPPELGNLAALESLSLSGMTGPIPPELGKLSALESLSLSGMTGPIPPELGKLSALESLSLSGITGPIPPELGKLSALESLSLSGNLTGSIPPELGNLASLTRLDLKANALTGSIPRSLGNLHALTRLDLGSNALSGPIPPELGKLSALTWLDLRNNVLSGPIPPELGKLSALTWLVLGSNALTGEIPVQLGELTALEYLYLVDNALSGEIPTALGNLAALRTLSLSDNGLAGPIPPELGDLTALQWLYLSDNVLTGEIPGELGDLSALRGLWLNGNGLTGPIPRELGNLDALLWLDLSQNEGLSGALPVTLTALHGLGTLRISGTKLCVPGDPVYQRWLDRTGFYVAACSPKVAYLVQSIQSRDYPVPLVAGREALLRVFPTAPPGSRVPVPPVRARFYASGVEVHSVEIPGKRWLLPAEINEGDLAVSANVRIPGAMLRPGLEMVVEIDPEGTLDPALGIGRRLPAEGRTVLDVRSPPTMELTVVPFLWSVNPDSSIIATVRGMAADPEGHKLLRLSRALLPTNDWSVTAHEPVVTNRYSNSSLHSLTDAIRAMEGGRGYWMGTMGGSNGGVAWLGGWTNFSAPRDETIAHELGHNMSLDHAPCGNPANVDPNFPQREGRIGVWGYDFATGRLVPPDRPDVMSYCRPPWVSDYHFTNALRHRMRRETASASTRALLLWGGESENDGLHLEPAFVVDAMPVLPDSAGGYTLTGRDPRGRELFSVSFAMPAIADGDEGAGGFVYTLPVRPGWEALASVTLSAPDGRTAVLDGSTDRPMTIFRDAATGRVRAFLGGVESTAQADAVGGTDVAAAVGAVTITSRGIPDAQAWRR